MKRTSEEWAKVHDDVLVYDPDGWGRKNFQFSWYEEQITEDEFFSRRLRSSLIPNRTMEEKRTEEPRFDVERLKARIERLKDAVARCAVGWRLNGNDRWLGCYTDQLIAAYERLDEWERQQFQAVQEGPEEGNSGNIPAPSAEIATERL